MKILFVYEYGPRFDDAMMSDLITAIEKRRSDFAWRYCMGFSKVYRPGGLRFMRLLNFAFMYCRLMYDAVFFRPDIILVRTTPPCIQVFATWIGRIFGMRVVCWLMDYHPEIEARMADARGWRRIAKLLRNVDRRSLQAMSCIIVLDNAMAELCKERAPGIPVVVHPTWSGSSASFAPMRSGGDGAELHFVYAGNLGAAHDTSTLCELFKRIGAKVGVKLTVIGAPPSGERRFEELAMESGVTLRCLPRTPFSKLGEVFDEYGIEIGIVLMSEQTAGLVSPSKFSGYITYGRPILYIGPEGTNAHVIVDSFGAGIGLPNHASSDTLERAVQSLCARNEREEWTAKVENACLYFNKKCGESLADELLPYL
jgi:colanic acid biosynthesis glycosyl transferase WcaI